MIDRTFQWKFQYDLIMCERPVAVPYFQSILAQIHQQMSL